MSAPDALRRGFQIDNRCAEAIGFLASGASASNSERMVVHALLEALKTFSHRTAQHSVRVGLHVAEFCKVLGYSDRDAFRFGFCACLHDIGKLGIPITLLEKPGSFSEAEREIAQAHVLEDFACLDYFKACNREPGRQIIRSHHENYDGTGYPDGLAGNLIPEVAQIARICDFFDAVNSDRPYRKGLNRKETIASMQQNAPAFNPEFFRAFVGNIELIARRSSL